ncbi:energy transducer TonB [Flavobacterium sp. J49]|uniref:energy transducer TonB n=1 Tax=Flavobacterium sp. J49 TaxID=2718534 RepID=UPI001592D6D5|nr:energy transducer TonB [Flavobacterium sp. J49]MBF6642472.1 energy transducer TonB [Flavobacterium sp. J49]NIC03718.1 energy transducer TonB [Flavobacterium sp. J49]
MSNVSIYEKNWIDLVFEGKNKAYGAYQLRQENARTSLLALIGGVTFFLSAIGAGLFLTSFGDVPVDEPKLVFEDYEITPVDLTPKKEIEKPAALKKEQQAPNTVEPNNLSRMVVTETERATDNVPTNNELRETPPPSEGNGTGTIPTTSGSEGGSSIIDEVPSGTGVETTNNLDVLPKYPGGIEKFYEYVVRRFERPEIDEDGNVTMSVMMSFVIEKDGTLTDIKAIRSTNYQLEKEAIRLLKASKVKWEPGIKNGKPVRTLFMLPIKVKL